MYRITSYDYNDKKDITELEDEDSLRDMVKDYVNDLENKTVKSFIVSRISRGFPRQKPFWEE